MLGVGHFCEGHYDKEPTSLRTFDVCEGCFCYIATRRAEGDHYVDLNFREGVVEPKIQPRAINSAQGLMGYFQKVF
jgi:hypothetical protein